MAQHRWVEIRLHSAVECSSDGWRRTVYEHYGSRTISSISFFPGTPLLCTSSLDVARQVLMADAGYWKAPDSTAALMWA